MRREIKFKNNITTVAKKITPKEKIFGETYVMDEMNGPNCLREFLELLIVPKVSSDEDFDYNKYIAGIEIAGIINKYLNVIDPMEKLMDKIRIFEKEKSENSYDGILPLGDGYFDDYIDCDGWVVC